MIGTGWPSYHRRIAGASRCRRGLATGWLLIWAPAFLLLLLLAIEIGNVMLAKVQLVSALEAASLAAVKEWKNGTNASARTYAVGYAAANTVSGQSVMLDRNDSPPNDPNGNASPNGEVVLGAVERLNDHACRYCFDPGTNPGGGGTGFFVDLNVRVETVNGTRQDVIDDVNGDFPFKIDGFAAVDGSNVPVPDLEIATIQYDVSTSAPGQLDPLFDLRVKSSGNSTDKSFGLVPQFASSNVSLSPADFFSSPAHAVVPNNSTQPQSSTFQLNFSASSSDPFRPGDSMTAGVDTDGVGPDPGTGPANSDFKDIGCDFAGTTVTVTFRQNGGPIVGQIVGQMENFLDGNNNCQSRLGFEGAEVMSGEFGVLTRKSMQVTPICQSLLGSLSPFTSFTVCGEATAVCERGGMPKLVKFFNCPP